MARRVALTKAQAGSRVGTKLIEALTKILDDGVITPKEVEALQDWLERAKQQDDFEALRFLSEEVEVILEDGEITQYETLYLAEAAIRVLPADLRAEAKAKLKRTVADMPTEKQVSFIHDLGGVLSDDATKQDASELIEKLLAQRPTIRQRMVLKFWGRDDMATAGVDGVSRWMDEFYAEDRDRAVAWEIWKRESPENSSRDPSLLDKIKHGIGLQYLAKAKASKKQTEGLVENKPTINQRIVMKFWGRDDLSNKGANEVANWLENFYSEDPQRREAWEIWKRQQGAKARDQQRLLEQMEYGSGERYLLMAKAQERHIKAKGKLALALRVAIYSAVLVFVAITIWIIIKSL